MEQPVRGIPSGARSVDALLVALPLHECALAPSASGADALELLTNRPALPGVVIAHGGTFVGMISRHRLHEHLSRPYGREMYLPRSVSLLLERSGDDHLLLPGTTEIRRAGYAALMRARDNLEEPLVVQVDSSYRLLDVHDLLVAQAQILELASHLLEETNRQLTELTVLDPLTGCGNRRLLDQVLKRDWAYAQRDGKWISLILGDIDHFKLFNDEYGHVAGDDCLRAVANVLRSNCRRVTDTVVRFGGEEFLLVLPATKPENAERTAESIREALVEAALEHRASPLCGHLTMSFGVVSTRPAPDGTPDQLVAAADAALYQAKSEGRDRFVSVVMDAGQPPPS